MIWQPDPTRVVWVWEWGWSIAPPPNTSGASTRDYTSLFLPMDDLDRLREQGAKTSAIIRLFQCIIGPRVRRQYFMGWATEVSRLSVRGWSLIGDDLPVGTCKASAARQRSGRKCVRLASHILRWNGASCDHTVNIELLSQENITMDQSDLHTLLILIY